MATVTPILRTSKRRADGHAPIWLRFADAQRTVYASLGVHIHPRFWNDRKNEVRKGYEHTDRLNALIARRLSDVEDERLRLLTEREPVTAEALRAIVQATPLPAESACFLAYIDTFLETVRRGGNVRRYRKERAVVAKLEEFAGRPLTFERLTPHLLREFEAHLIGVKKNKASTSKAGMGVLSLHYRRAIREGVVSRESDPFFSFKPRRIKKPDRPKLSVDQFRALTSLDLGTPGESAPLLARTRDLFAFALYAAGVRFGDAVHLRLSNLSEDGGRMRLSYVMGKNDKRMAVLLVPEAEAIARAYSVRADGTPKAGSDLLFPNLDGYDLSTPEGDTGAVSSQNAVTNKNLKALAVLAKIKGPDGKPFPLTFHIARHSFADIARKAGWDTYAISKALGHSGLQITEHYLSGFDGEALDGGLAALFAEDGAETPDAT